MKVVLNPKHFHVRAKAEDGTIWLTHEKFRQAIIPIKDVTNDVLLALCADLSADGVTQTIERTVRFADGWECLLTVQVVKDREHTAISAMPDSFDRGWNAAIEAAAGAMEHLSFMTDIAELIGMSKQQMSERTCREGASAIRRLKKDTG